MGSAEWNGAKTEDHYNQDIIGFFIQKHWLQMKTWCRCLKRNSQTTNHNLSSIQFRNPNVYLSYFSVHRLVFRNGKSHWHLPCFLVLKRDNAFPGKHSTSQDIFKRLLLCDAITMVPPAILWSIEEDSLRADYTTRAKQSSTKPGAYILEYSVVALYIVYSL